MHDPGNNSCPLNADPRNECCACDPAPDTWGQPKYGGADGAQLCVDVLRERLDTLTMRLDRGWDRPGHPFKPMQRRKLEIQADETATCIEILTRNGNYSRERHEAMVRLRPLSTRIEDLTK